MLHPGSAMPDPHGRAAQIKTTLSFQNLEAALPLGILQAADPVAREVLFIPELATLVQFRGRMDGPHGGIEDRFPRVGKTIGMQSEPCLPRTILCVCPRQCGEEGARHERTRG